MADVGRGHRHALRLAAGPSRGPRLLLDGEVLVGGDVEQLGDRPRLIGPAHPDLIHRRHRAEAEGEAQRRLRALVPVAGGHLAGLRAAPRRDLHLGADRAAIGLAGAAGSRQVDHDPAVLRADVIAPELDAYRRRGEAHQQILVAVEIVIERQHVVDRRGLRVDRVEPGRGGHVGERPVRILLEQIDPVVLAA